MIYWALLGGFLASWCEYLYRTVPGTWLQNSWMWVPLQVLVGYCVYQIVTTPNTSLLEVFVVWTFATMLLRVLFTLVLGDVVTTGTWIALSLIVMAKVAQYGIK